MIVNGADNVNALYPECILRPGASTVLKIKCRHKETLIKLIVTTEVTCKAQVLRETHSGNNQLMSWRQWYREEMYLLCSTLPVTFRRDFCFVTILRPRQFASPPPPFFFQKQNIMPHKKFYSHSYFKIRNHRI